MPRNLSSNPVRTKAMTYLREGHVVVHMAVRDTDGPRRPHTVTADVIGHNSTYLVTLTTTSSGGCWQCTCHREDCPHVPAVELVTGWPSEAARHGA